MHKYKRKFNIYWISFVWILGIQFLALPFYHFHPDIQHSHPGESSHRHNGYFHSIQLESIVHLTHSNDHNPADHHSQHSDSKGEVDSGVDLNSETLKSKNPFKVLKFFSTIKFQVIPKEFKTYYLQKKLKKFQGLVFKNQLRERSPPFLFI
jgi:hypothetical protein